MTITFDAPDLTAVLAWLGSLSGVAALIWQIATWRRLAHNVKVTRTQSWVPDIYGNLGEDLVCIEARNVGASAVTVTNWGIALGRGGRNLVVLYPLPLSTTLPHRLEPGASMNLFVLADALAQAKIDNAVPLKRMRGWVGLATGKKVYAKRGVPVSES